MKTTILSLIIMAAAFSSTAQNVGINTPIPTETLDVNGTVKITDGTQGDGKVLTSDAQGRASWKPTAYGENIRFSFSRQSNYNSPYVEENYNEGNTDVDLDGSVIGGGAYYFPGLLLYISEPGLYHFDINSHSESILINGTPPAPKNSEVRLLRIMQIGNTNNYDLKLLGISYGAPIMITSGGSFVSSIDKSIDAYFATSGMFYVFSETDFSNISTRLTVSGAKIAY